MSRTSRRARQWAWLALALALVSPRAARADDVRDTDTSERAIAPRPLPIAAAALLPGPLVVGTGHRLAGRSRAANRLLWAQIIGLAVGGGSGLILHESGASRRLTIPTVPLIVGGSGLWLVAWAADIYGAAGGGRRGARPRLTLPPITAELAYQYVYDPRFDYGSFARVRGEAWWGAWRIAPAVDVATGDDNQRARVEAGYRLRGPTARGEAAGGGAMDVTAGVMMHRYDEGFAAYTADALVSARWELGRVSPTLAGSFAEAGLGLAFELTDYEASAGLDASAILLARFAFGMYLGCPGAGHGEVALRYRHRRDGFAGGLASNLPINGFVGNFGLTGFWDRPGRLGFSASLWVGSAYVMSAGVRLRFGGAS